MRIIAYLATVILLAGGCTSGGQDVAADPEEPTAATLTPTATEPAVNSGQPRHTAENCHALSVYLANGGFSDDDTYDPATDMLTIYGDQGREFVLSPRDANCIAGSPAISRRVRNALGAYEDSLDGAIHSRLLSAARS